MEIWKDIENLEWVTQSENQLHSYQYNLKKTKQVNQYDLQGNFIKTWKNIITICKNLNYKKTNLSRCCNGKNKTAYGFIWKFVGDK